MGVIGAFLEECFRLEGQTAATQINFDQVLIAVFAGNPHVVNKGVEFCRTILADSGLPVIMAKTLAEAADASVACLNNVSTLAEAS